MCQKEKYLNTNLIVRKGVLINEANTEVQKIKRETEKVFSFSVCPVAFPTESNKNIPTDFEQELRAALIITPSCERGRRSKEGTSIEVKSHNLVTG